ncbi:MAG: hypothetical protein AAB131_24005, partial [Actinomycetota bacterium]
MYNSDGGAIHLISNASYNTISYSTAIGGDGNVGGGELENSHWNVFTRSYLACAGSCAGGDGVEIHTGSNYNTVSYSTLVSVGISPYAALWIGEDSSS